MEKYDYEELAILVNSCDKYYEALNPFFSLLKIQWTDNVQKKDYSNVEKIKEIELLIDGE